MAYYSEVAQTDILTDHLDVVCLDKVGVLRMTERKFDTCVSATYLKLEMPVKGIKKQLETPTSSFSSLVEQMKQLLNLSY